MDRAVLGLITIGVAAFVTGAVLMGIWLSASQPTDNSSAKTVTVRESTALQPINKTVPLKETHTENNHYYTQPCKGTLPDTGPSLRRHKAH